jgi:hypothetical protein
MEENINGTRRRISIRAMSLSTDIHHQHICTNEPHRTKHYSVLSFFWRKKTRGKKKKKHRLRHAPATPPNAVGRAAKEMEKEGQGKDDSEQSGVSLTSCRHDSWGSKHLKEDDNMDSPIFVSIHKLRFQHHLQLQSQKQKTGRTNSTVEWSGESSS